MFVPRQNGVIKLKLVSSVDKSIKPLQLFLVSFWWGGCEVGGCQGDVGGCPTSRYVCGCLLALGHQRGSFAAGKQQQREEACPSLPFSTESGKGGQRHLTNGLK